MTTLASATLALAKILGTVVEGTGNAGSATSLTDDDFEYLPDGASAPPNDYYNGGTVWILDGTHAGKTSFVTDWDQTTKVVTFSTLTTTIGNTARYALTTRDYPRFVLRQAVNYALGRIGGVPQRYEDAAFITVADQLEYTIPAGVSNIKRVEVATSLTSPYNYSKWYRWDPIDGSIVFDDGFQPRADDYRIRLTYQAPLAELDADADTIPDVINLEYIKWEAAVYAYRWRLGKMRDRDNQTAREVAEALKNAADMAASHRPEIEEIARDPKLGPWTGGRSYGGEEIDRVRL